MRTDITESLCHTSETNNIVNYMYSKITSKKKFSLFIFSIIEMEVMLERFCFSCGVVVVILNQISMFIWYVQPNKHKSIFTFPVFQMFLTGLVPCSKPQ